MAVIRLKLNDRFIQGTVAFEDHGDTANMSYLGKTHLPLNVRYEIGGKKWKVIQTKTSFYNPQVINVNMVQET